MSHTPALIAAAAILAPTAAHAIEWDWSMLVEAEYSDLRSDDGSSRDHRQDAYIATFELATGLQFNEHWRTDLVLLAEDIGNTDHNDYAPSPGATDQRPDELHVDHLTLGYSRGPYSFAAGRYTLPFGQYRTAVISDPQTLEVGETASDLAISIAGSHGRLSWHLDWFEGNRRSSAPEESGLAAGIEWQATEKLRVGTGYLSNQHAGRGMPALWDLYAAAELGPWQLHAEYVGAAVERNGERPRAWSLDAAYSLDDRWSAGARWQATDRFGVLDGGDGSYRELALAVSCQVTGQLGLALEYSRGEEGPASARQWLLQVSSTF